MSFVDLLFRGQPRAIATAVLSGAGGLALVDPGPTTCLATLEAGMQRYGASWADVTHLLLTHIHLDHAGASGEIVRRAPHVRVVVHERGAPHMIDPARLLASATRLYGDQMDTLWGAFVPVPAENVVVVGGGEALECAGRRVRVAYTPGHAVHHVSYLDESSGVAYVGDTGGMRVAGDFLVAPTPPPDIDLDAWAASLDTIEAWAPEELFLTHFGPATLVKSHIPRFRDVLQRQAAFVRETLELPGDDAARVAMFVERVRADARAVLSEADAVALETAGPFDQIWAGLARYWRKRA